MIRRTPSALVQQLKFPCATFQLGAPSRDFWHRESGEPGSSLRCKDSCARSYEYQLYGKPFGAGRFKFVPPLPPPFTGVPELMQRLTGERPRDPQLLYP